MFKTESWLQRQIILLG